MLRLLLGTLIYRPYVYAFFACFLYFAIKQLRWRGGSVYIFIAWWIAFGCEYSATHNGFPFGFYRYFDVTRDRELWITNVPFWDSLSFVFLSYFSWILAGSLRTKSELRTALLQPSTALLAGLLMMMLDVVIDPLTLLGEQWFLGKVYDYPGGGPYFGVTFSNFAGWFFVGTVITLAYQRLARFSWIHSERWRTFTPLELRAVFALYAGVFVFNLCITAWLKEWSLLLAGSFVTCVTLLPCHYKMRQTQMRSNY